MTPALSKLNMPSSRPFNIALVNLSDDPRIDLEKLSNDMNHIQISRKKLFRFQPVEGDITSLGPYDLPHGYSNKKFFGLIGQRLNGTGISYGIGITVEELESSRFNSHDEEAGVGLVTFYNHDEYKPHELTLYQYLAYLILCEAFCITSRTHLEHDDKHLCLFDECSNKKDLKLCLKRPFIHCRSGLKSLGFHDEDLTDADAILRYVSKRSFTNAAIKTFSNPLVGILLGGGIVNLLSSKIAELGDTGRWIITGVLFVAILLFLRHNYFGRKRN